jgi:hypothetical protein
MSAPQIPEQLNDPGFFNWLRQYLQSVGETAGDIGMWIGRNTLRAFQLYREYQNLIGPVLSPVSPRALQGTPGELVSGFTGGTTQAFPMPAMPGLPAPTQPAMPQPSGTGGNGSTFQARRTRLVNQAVQSNDPALQKIGRFF